MFVPGRFAAAVVAPGGEGLEGQDTGDVHEHQLGPEEARLHTRYHLLTKRSVSDPFHFDIDPEKSIKIPTFSKLFVLSKIYFSKKWFVFSIIIIIIFS